MVTSGAEPEPDWMRDGAVVLDVYRDSTPDRRDLTSDLELDAMVLSYREARAAEAAQKKIADELRPQIIRALGNAEIGVTANWELAARTSHRAGHTVPPTSTRVLRVKPRENLSASF